MSGERLDYSATSFNASQLTTEIFLGITMDGNSMAAAEYSRRESVGVSLLIATSCLSLTAVLGLLVLMGVAAWSNRSSECKNYFFRSNVAPYFLCLLLADLIQAIASIMNARWLQLGGVQQGDFCTTQAVLKQVSDVGSAIWSLVVSVQTFSLLFFQLHSPRWVGWVVLGFSNGLVVMFAFLGPAVYKTKAQGDFYGISGYWCWITAEYDMARVSVDYLILFLSSFFSFILYSLVFFRLRGNIVVTGWHVRFRLLEKDESGWRGRQHADSHALRIAKQMILHPVAYTILFLPIAVLRLCEWTGRPVSFPVMMLCDSIFLLSGVVDVVLFCTIRRVIPVKEVAKALFTGQVFRARESSPTDLTWFIGSLEAGEKCPSDDPSLQADDDIFILRQPKFEIVAPPQAVHSGKTVMSMAQRQTMRLPLAINTEVVSHTDPQPPRPKTRTVSRKLLPREHSIHSDDGKDQDRPSPIPRQGSIRKLPPIPQGYRATTLPPVSENQGNPPPHYRPTMTNNDQSSVTRPVPSRSRSESIGSTVSDTSLISGSTLLGSADNDGLKDDGSSKPK